MGMKWSKDDMPLLVVEEGGYEGVRRIAGKVAEDIGKVLGAAPEVTDLKGHLHYLVRHSGKKPSAGGAGE